VVVPAGSTPSPQDQALTYLTGLDAKTRKRLLKLLQVRDTRIDFVKNHHKNQRGEDMDFEDIYHMREIYESSSPEIVIMGGTQTFKSEWMIVDLLAMAYNAVNCFYVLPKHDFKVKYVQNRINKPIDDSPFYKQILKDADVNRIDNKRFGKGTMEFVDSNVYANFKSSSADAYYVEECDECDWDNVAFGYSRLDASPFQFKRFLGNPTTEEGPIYKELWLISSQKFWHCPCKSCGQKSKLDFLTLAVEQITDKDGNVLDYRLLDTEWKRGCGRDIKLLCPHCKTGEIDRFSPDSEWIAEKPDNKMEGYHVPSLCSKMTSVAKLWSEFKEAINDPTKMKDFYNRRLGWPFTSVTNNLSDALLAKNAKLPEFTITDNEAYVKENKHKGPCSMGIDINGTVLDIRISYPVGTNRDAVYFGKVDASNKQYVAELEERFNVKTTVVDIGPETNYVNDLRELLKNDVWFCKYLGIGSERVQKENEVDMIISVDRTEVMDRAYARLKSGRNRLPKNYDAVLAGEFVQEMTKPKRQATETNDMKIKYSWVGKPDHCRHADVYDLLASEYVIEDGLNTCKAYIIGESDE
jgi:hypothetical protein